VKAVFRKSLFIWPQPALRELLKVKMPLESVKDATDDKGVSSKQEDTQEGTGHASELDKIAEAVKDQHFEEIGEESPVETDEKEDKEIDDDDKKEEAAEESSDEKTEDDQADIKDESGTDESEEPATVEIVVDGEKKVVPLSEVLDAGKRTYQKEQAADLRLEEATKLLKQAKETKQLPEKDADKIEETDAKPKEFSDVRKELVDAIQYGEDEDVDNAFAKMFDLIGGDEKSTTGKEDLKKEIRAEIKAESINDLFSRSPENGGYKDLVDNPKSFMLVYSEINQKLEDGEPNNWETYQKAGDEIRKFLGWDKDSTPENNKNKLSIEDGMEAKREKKRKIDPIDSVSAKTKSSVKEEKEPTPAEVIAEMAKARPGQQLY
jgi:hypothetical protein